MSRTTPDVPKSAESSPSPRLLSLPRIANPAPSRNVWIFRFLLVVCASAIGAGLAPFGLRGWLAAALGASVALSVLLAENLLRAPSTVSVLGGTLGALSGAILAALMSLVIFRISLPESSKSFL